MRAWMALGWAPSAMASATLVCLKSWLSRYRDNHDVRHSYATAALAAGERVEVVSRRLGHANVSVTLNIYAHVTDADDQDTADRVAARICQRP